MFLGNPWMWHTLRVTLVSFELVPRLECHKTKLEVLLSMSVRVFNCFLLSCFCLFVCLVWFGSSTQVWKLLLPFWFGIEVIWKTFSIQVYCLLWKRPAPRKRASAFRKVLHLQKRSLTWRLLKYFPFCLHLGRFFFFSSSFLMVFSKGSKWHWSVKVDSKIYNVFVLADCQQNRPFPAVLYADSENQ